MKIAVPLFWKNASLTKKRIYSILIMFAIAILFTIIGIYIPVDHQTAVSYYNDLNQTVSSYGTNYAFATESIFLNNFPICLSMFIPIVGPIRGLATILNTGIYIGAISTITGHPATLYIINLIASPVTWMEFAAYSIAMAESVWLLRRLLQQKWSELKTTAILIGACALILIISALVEAWLLVNQI